MKLHIYQSAQGDCLLLEADSGALVLCDGGMHTSMRMHVRSALGALRDKDREIEYVYVSHIDQDHISGVLQLLDDEARWRVYDHHRGNEENVKRPDVPRPPVIKGIFHNAFRDQVSENAGAIGSLLAASASSLYAAGVPELSHRASEMRNIAASIPEALKVSRLAAEDALNIPVNRPPGGDGPARLMYAGQGVQSFDVGSMRFTLVGPTEEELEQLRDGWQNWLRVEANREAVRKIRSELRRRIDEFSAGALAEAPFDLSRWNGIPDHKGVTVPNIASLMFMVEENGRRLLLTGDSQQDFIVAGLKRAGFLDAGYVHLDVLKVQHHGSENNLDLQFARCVSADHYVFCGNGEHGNPERSVIDLVYASRMGDDDVRALAPDAQDRRFHFWFSTDSGWEPATEEAVENFEEMKAHVQELQKKSGGRLKLHFNNAVSSVLEI
jgi:hypothetical protein